jgi:ubiquitin C-terminal hydrolase
MDEHIQKVINSTGFNDFYEDFSKQEINTLEINLDNKTYGLAVKKKQNPDWNPKYDDNDMVSQYFQFAPKVGLANIGATCYMNATLQCFCQIEEFTSYFKYHSHVKNVIQKYNNISQKCLTTSFKTLIENIWPGNAMKVDSSKRFYEPHDFRQKIAEMSPLFENVGANDAKDLVNFIIMTLHEELNEPLPKINNLIINNQEDPNDVFNVFIQDYQNDFRSKISELFYAIQKNSNYLFKFQLWKSTI